MGSNYLLHPFDIVSHTPTAMLSARSSPTATNGAGLSNAEKVTLYVVAATAAVLIVVGIAIAVLRARCHDGPWGAHSSGQPRQHSMAKALLKTIPLVQYDDTIDSSRNCSRPSFDGSMESLQSESGKASISEKSTVGNSTCAICTEEFVKNQLVRVLPCGHVFHQGCVDEWLVKRSRTCPTCRYELTPSCKNQATEKDKHSPDIEGGLPDVEARHTQPQSRMHGYLRSLRSTFAGRQ